MDTFITGSGFVHHTSSLLDSHRDECLGVLNLLQFVNQQRIHIHSSYCDNLSVVNESNSSQFLGVTKSLRSNFDIIQQIHALQSTNPCNLLWVRSHQDTNFGPRTLSESLNILADSFANKAHDMVQFSEDKGSTDGPSLFLHGLYTPNRIDEMLRKSRGRYLLISYINAGKNDFTIPPINYAFNICFHKLQHHEQAFILKFRSRWLPVGN